MWGPGREIESKWSGILGRALRPIMSGKPTHDTPTIQSLDRGLAILEAVAASSEPVALKQLTELMGIDRSSVFRLANTLRQRRFLANPKGSNDYILGPTAWRIVAEVRAKRPRDVLSSVPSRPDGDARRNVALRGPRRPPGVLHRPSHADGSGRLGCRADGRVRAAALHGAWQGAARRLRSQQSEKPVRTSASPRCLHPQYDHDADQACPRLRTGSQRRFRTSTMGSTSKR